MNSIKEIKNGVQAFSLEILLPAYNADKKGIVVKISMEVKEDSIHQIKANGTVAVALKKMMERAIAILSSLDNRWSIIKQLQYNLMSEDNNLRVMDARSAGLPLCIGLLNVIRKLNGKNEVQNLIGTGILRIDGAFDESSLEEVKEQAVQQTVEHEKIFVDSGVCQHVFDLATLMNCSKP